MRKKKKRKAVKELPTVSGPLNPAGFLAIAQEDQRRAFRELTPYERAIMEVN